MNRPELSLVVQSTASQAEHISGSEIAVALKEPLDELPFVSRHHETTNKKEN